MIQSVGLRPNTEADAYSIVCAIDEKLSLDQLGQVGACPTHRARTYFGVIMMQVVEAVA
jgi:hypothetical protein